MAYLVDQSQKTDEQSKTIFGICQSQPEVLETVWMAETIDLMVLFLIFIPWFYYVLLRKCDKIRTRRTERRTEAILAEHQGRQTAVTPPALMPVSPPVTVAVAAAPAVLPVEAPVQMQERAPTMIIEYDHGYGARPRQRSEAMYVDQPPSYRYNSETSPDFRPLPTLRANPFVSQRLFEMNLPRSDRRSRRQTRVITREDLPLALRGPVVDTEGESDQKSVNDA